MVNKCHPVISLLEFSVRKSVGHQLYRPLVRTVYSEHRCRIHIRIHFLYFFNMVSEPNLLSMVSPSISAIIRTSSSLSRSAPISFTHSISVKLNQTIFNKWLQRSRVTSWWNPVFLFFLISKLMKFFQCVEVVP